MPLITNDFIKILQNVQRPGDFYATDTVEIFVPRLEIEGVGPVALPLLPVQAEQIVEAADRAPYGRGEKTVVDTEVRRTWQIDAGRVDISGKHWQRDLDAIVKRAATAHLGIHHGFLATVVSMSISVAVWINIITIVPVTVRIGTISMRIAPGQRY